MVTDMQIPVLMSSDKLTQPIIAPVQDTLVAKQNYAVGDEFIYNNGLYKATAVINATDPITIGTNAVAVPSVMEQLREKTLSGTTNKSDLVAQINALTQEQYLSSYLEVLGTTYITRKVIIRPCWSDVRTYLTCYLDNKTSGVATISTYGFDSRNTGSLNWSSATNTNASGQLVYESNNDTLAGWTLHWRDF